MRSRRLLFIVCSVLLLFCCVLPDNALRAEVQQAADIPWSGYWWPARYGGLSTGSDYRGHPAPL